MAFASKRPLKFIEDTKSRNLTFRKRKKGLKKRGCELATLCNIKLMLIIYGPNGAVDTWPAEHDQVKDVIERYQKVRGAKGEVSLDLHGYFKEQIKKKESQIVRITKDCSCLESSQKKSMPNSKAMKALARRLDSKIDSVKDRINALIASHKIGFEQNSSSRELIIHQESYHNGYPMAEPQGVEHERRSPVGGEVGVGHEWSLVFEDIIDDPLSGTTDQFYRGYHEIEFEHNNSSGELKTHQESYHLITHQESYHNGYLMANPQGLEHEWRREVNVEYDLGDLFTGCDGGEVESYHNGYLMVDPQGAEHEWSPVFDDTYQKLEHQELELVDVVDHYNMVFANALCQPLIDTDNQIRGRDEAFFLPWDVFEAAEDHTMAGGENQNDAIIEDPIKMLAKGYPFMW